MELLWKAMAVACVTVILGAVLQKSGKELFVLLSLGACIAIGGIVLSFLKPVVEFVRELESLGNLHGEMLGVLLKAVGMGLVTEVAATVCTDSGNGSVGKLLQLMGSAVILWTCLPIFRTTLALIEGILGEL